MKLYAQWNKIEQNIKIVVYTWKKFERDFGVIKYPHYDNYDAIEVPFTECIPSDYDGVMGVPITFMDKFNPEQFEIIGATESEGKGFSQGLWNKDSGVAQPMVASNRIYKRIFIRPKRGGAN